MNESVQIAFRNMTPPIGVEAAIRDEAAQLERFFDRIVSCSVVVEARHRRHHQGNLYQVAIELTVPDRKIVVRRASPEHHSHEDLHVALRDAFSAAQRQLQDHARIRRE